MYVVCTRTYAVRQVDAMQGMHVLADRDAGYSSFYASDEKLLERLCG